MKKFVYFVSFAYACANGYGYGNTTVASDHPITTQDVILNIEKEIENQIQKKVKVLNFQFLTEDE